MKTHKPSRGFSLIELLVIVFIVGAITLVLTPSAGKMIRRARALSAISNLNRELAKARLECIKRGFQVVVQVSWNATKGQIHLHAWEDRNPDGKEGTYTPPGGGANVQEAVLLDFDSESTFHLWKQGGTIDDVSTAVAFNSYLVGTPATLDTSLTSRVVFLPTGGILAPQDSASGPPTPSGGRGLYVADERGKNYFRLTFPGTAIGKVRVEKWIDSSTGYQANNWRWL